MLVHGGERTSIGREWKRIPSVIRKGLGLLAVGAGAAGLIGACAPVPPVGSSEKHEVLPDAEASTTLDWRSTVTLNGLVGENCMIHGGMDLNFYNYQLGSATRVQWPSPYRSGGELSCPDNSLVDLTKAQAIEEGLIAVNNG